MTSFEEPKRPLQSQQSVIAETLGVNLLRGLPKRVVEVIHPNETMRTYAVTASFVVPDYGIVKYAANLHESIRPLVEQLFEMPAVADVYLTRGEIRIEVTAAYIDYWDEVSPIFQELVNQHFFNGEAEVTVRNEREKYFRERRYQKDWYYDE